jgi:nucleotide-binding universal stress UspA family protein
MECYKNILVAVELNPVLNEPIVKRAVEIAKCQQGQLFLVHTVEDVGDYATLDTYPFITNMDMQEELLKKHRSVFAALGKSLSIPDSQQYLKLGKPAAVIKDLAKAIPADLIIIGKHNEPHGLAALFRSTSESILQHVECDVLAVYIS